MSVEEQVRDELKLLKNSYLFMITICIACVLLATNLDEEHRKLKSDIERIETLQDLFGISKHSTASDLITSINRLHWKNSVFPEIEERLTIPPYDKVCVKASLWSPDLSGLVSFFGGKPEVDKLPISLIEKHLKEKVMLLSQNIQSAVLFKSTEVHLPSRWPIKDENRHCDKVFRVAEYQFSSSKATLQLLLEELPNGSYFTFEATLNHPQSDEKLLQNWLNDVLKPWMPQGQAYGKFTLEQALPIIKEDFYNSLSSEQNTIEIISLKVPAAVAGNLFFSLLILLQLVLLGNTAKVKTFIASNPDVNILPPSLIFCQSILAWFYRYFVYLLIPVTSLFIVNYNLQLTFELWVYASQGMCIILLAFLNMRASTRLLHRHVSLVELIALEILKFR